MGSKGKVGGRSTTDRHGREATWDTEVLKSVPLGQRARGAWPRKALEGSREAAHGGSWWRFLVFIIREIIEVF